MIEEEVFMPYKLTIFALPKPFRGHIGTIQRNAIESWTRLTPRPDILLLGNEQGTAEAARDLDVRHIPEINCNEFGTPLVNDIFRLGQSSSDADVIAYVNSDIILFDDFVHAANLCRKNFPEFLMIGQRYNLLITDHINFMERNWETRLRKKCKKHGLPGNEFALDFFAFTPGLWSDIPPFALGRFCWDNWLSQAAHFTGKPVVNVSPSVLVIHQMHSYALSLSQHFNNFSINQYGKECMHNRILAGTKNSKYTLYSANFVIDISNELVSKEKAEILLHQAESDIRKSWYIKTATTAVEADLFDVSVSMLEELLRW